MEDDLVRPKFKGMESVVATVSGYHGSERFNLIKMISQSGASYVGAMNPSTTHLVCRKFEGRKYELARKFKIVIVNHKWIEDCIKQGRRVPERPYTKHCGKEVSPLLLKVSISDKISPLLPKLSSACNNLEESVVGIECGESDNDVWTDSWLLKENLSSECGQRKIRSIKSKRKGIKRSLRVEQSMHSRYSFDESPLSGSRCVESEDLSSSPTRLVRQKWSSTNCSTTAEPSRKGRRLVKKNVYRKVLDSSSDSEHECNPIHVRHQNDDIATPSNYSFGGNDESRWASNVRFHDHERSRAELLDDVDEIEDLNNTCNLEDLSRSECANSSLVGDPQNHCSTVDEDSKEIQLIPRLPTSPELSCVICLTDFSSTRGVLACGHRFCFSCIQSWADHMASMRKISTCPLCKASFVCIQRVDDAVSSDQKIYSQTVPHDFSDLYILPDGETSTLGAQPSSAPVCYQCYRREPEDLLVRCHLCQIRCVHSYCLDPLVLPWTCIHCKDLQRLYYHVR